MIVILLAFSIWRIRKFSKILVQSQIFANECLMVSHLAAFTYLALLNIYSQTINIIYQGSSDYTLEEMSDRRKRILLSSVVVQYLSVGGCLAVVITMMIMFLKHSQSKDLMSKNQHKEITNRFMLVFSGVKDLSEINKARIN